MLAVNIPADALFLTIQNSIEGDLSEKNCTEIIKRYIARYLEAKPDVIMLNVCYRRCLTPSEVFDSYLYDVETDSLGLAKRRKNGKSIKKLSPTSINVSKYFDSFFLVARPLLEKGIDIYKTAIEEIKKTSCKVFLSVRMNDRHFTENPAINSSFATKFSGRHTIAKDGHSLDFSDIAVQNYFYEYIKELLSTYSPDGIELDWLRYPRALPDGKKGELNILNGFHKRIRTLLDSHNKGLGLAVRVLPHEKTNLADGVDACAWISDGCVDILTIENFYVPTNYELPVSEWRESIKKRNVENRKYRLLCGSDWAVSCVTNYDFVMTPALVRGFADSSAAAGADGVYLFNFFEENDRSSFEFSLDKDGNPRLLSCFSERIAAAKNPLDLPRRYVHIGSTNERYPISLDSGEFYEYSIKISKPFEDVTLLVGFDKEESVTVSVNASLAKELKKNLPIYEGFEYIPPSEKKKDEFIYTLTEAAPFVKSFIIPTNTLFDGRLKIKIQNHSNTELNILWLEISCN